MAPVKVMLVDDAVVVRRVLQDSLGKDPDLEIVGAAVDGLDALEKIPTWRPEVVVLDVEMPKMDGIDTLRNIKKNWPNIRVVMFSTLTSRGAEATLDALAMGADDYVSKPTNTAGLADAMERVKLELVPKIKALRPVDRFAAPAASAQAPAPLGTTDRFAPKPTAQAAGGAPAAPGRMRAAGTGKVEVVVIGVSTGGPNALMEVMPALPANLSVPVVIVQHIPPVFSKALAERLDARSPLTVTEAYEGAVPTPGTAWIAPGDNHVTFGRDASGRIVLHTNQLPPENSCRPAVDVLFRSAAEQFGKGVLSLILTGMGSDGTKGAQDIIANGGTLLAQDQETSVVWGMPGSVVSAGLASGVYPLKDIATQISTRVGSTPGVGSVQTSASTSSARRF